MSTISYIDASKARIDFFKILDSVYFNKESFLIKKGGIPMAEICKPKSLSEKKSILEFAGSWADIDDKKMIEELYKARRDTGKSKRKLPAIS